MRNSYIICSGGGTKAISDMLTAGGASEYFIGAEVPYSQQTFIDCVGGEVWDGKHVSERTAHQLAAVAYRKCIRGDGKNKQSMGVGVTASLCKVENEREERTNHIYVAVKLDESRALTYRLKFNHKNRMYQELDCATLIKRIILEDFNTPPFDIIGNIPKVYSVVEDHIPVEAGQLFVFSGSFNPIHSGHLDMVSEIRQDYDTTPIFEIGGVHHHKPGITAYEYTSRYNEIKRVTQHGGIVRYGRYPMFVDKLRHYNEIAPNKTVTFIVGADVYSHISIDDKKKLNLYVFDRGTNSVINSPCHNVIHGKLNATNISSTSIRIEKRNEIQQHT